MVLGYPGRTSRYLTSTAVAARQEFFYPARLQLFSTIIDGLEEQAAQSDEATLRMASRIKSFANVEKNASGMIFGLERNAVVALKEAEEAQFFAWMDEEPGRRQRYGDAVERLFELDKVAAGRMAKDFVLDGLRRYSNSFRQAQTALRGGDEANAVTMDLADPERDVLFSLADNAPEKFRLRSYDQWKKKGSGDLVALARALDPEYKAQAAYRERESGERMGIGNLWIEAQELWRGKRFYPDANSTLRVSMASVKGYAPRDGVYHTPHTSVAGMLAKHTNEGEFDAPDAIFDAVKKDPSTRDIPVCFLANADTTGGNSGSPVVDGQGRLVGLNFDRVFENVAGDFGWSADRSRNISVDIRSVLWLMRSVWPAPRLLEEMQVATEHVAAKSAAATQPMLQVRIGLHQGDVGFEQAEKVEYKGGHLHLGLEKSFALKEVGVEEFVDGGFAISIEVEDREEFLQLTGKYTGRPMAILGAHDKIVSVPMIQNAIPGRLLLQGGSSGFSEDVANGIVEQLRKQFREVGSSENKKVESTNRGLPTMELGQVLEEHEKGYSDANVMQCNGKEFRIGKVYSFEVTSMKWDAESSGTPLAVLSVLDREGMHALTSEMVGHKVALMVAGKLFSVPVVQAPLRGSLALSGGSVGFTAEEKKLLDEHFK